MQRFISYILSVLTLITVISCAKDGEMLTASISGDGTQIGSIDDNIVLNIDTPSSLALTIFWDELGNATLSNPDAQFADDFVVNAIQFSADENFSSVIEKTVDNHASSVQFTTAQLNSIVTELGAESGTATSIYIRMRSSLGTGDGAEERFGNYIMITVTPYFIDMSFVTLEGTDGTEVTIPATDKEGSYAGFVSVPHTWWNFLFVEGNSTTYGSAYEGDEAVYYSLTTAADRWNCWFPEGENGSSAYDCYYVTMDREAMEWSALILREITVTYGTQTGSMEFVPGKTAWTYVFTTDQDNAALQVDGSGTQYNTGTTNTSPVSASLSFTVSGGNGLSTGTAGTASGITAGTAGTYTLILYLSDMTWELAEGEVDIEGGEDEGGDEPATEWPEDPDFIPATSDFLYLYNLSDQTPVSVYGRIGKVSDGVYEGYQYLSGWMNFKFGDNEDPSAAKIYGSVNSDTMEGALYRLYCGDDMYNIWWNSGTGAYLYLTVDMGARSWSYTEISSISIAGDFNSYSLTSDVMTFDPATHTWSAVITPGASWGEYGIQFCINGSWETPRYAPADGGKLEKTDNAGIPSVEVQEGVSYTVTIDIDDPENMTWSIEPVTEEGGDTDIYPESLYMIYTWNSGWPYESVTEDAAILGRMSDGVYSGFFTSGSTWDNGLTNYIFCDRSIGSITVGSIGSETRYGCTEDGVLAVKSSADNSDGIGACYLVNNLGLYTFEVNLVNMSFSRTYLGDAIYVSVDGNEQRMSFNETSLRWEASIDLTSGSSLTVRLDSDGKYVYGGADGILVTSDGSNAIIAGEDGHFLMEVDLKNSSAMTYSLTKE